MIYNKIFLLAAVLAMSFSQPAAARSLPSASAGGAASSAQWYIGAMGGTSFGQGTFRSITEDGVRWGAQGGVFFGCRLSRLISLEASVQYGAQTQESLDCCPYWLESGGTRYMSPVLDRTGWYYSELESRTQWGKLSLQANADILSLFTSPSSRWSLNLGPQLSAVTTRTELVAPDRTVGHGRQWHLGLGGQASVGFRMTEKTAVSLYGCLSSLTGERFDNVPEHEHKSNLIWDAGVKLAFSLGGRMQKERFKK